MKGKNMFYNGWTNKETWLVNIWYLDHMPAYFAEAGQYDVEPEELEDAVRYIVEESESLSQLPPGLLSDFINTCWAEVDWHELVSHLNENLKELGQPN
jgi:hypothetical protein